MTGPHLYGAASGDGLRLPRLSLYGDTVAPGAERRTDRECKFDATGAGAGRAPGALRGPPADLTLHRRHAVATCGPTAAARSRQTAPGHQRQDDGVPSVDISSSRARCRGAPQGRA